jgi:hypothetical protein
VIDPYQAPSRRKNARTRRERNARSRFSMSFAR